MPCMTVCDRTITPRVKDVNQVPHHQSFVLSSYLVEREVERLTSMLMGGGNIIS